MSCDSSVSCYWSVNDDCGALDVPFLQLLYPLVLVVEIV